METIIEMPENPCPPVSSSHVSFVVDKLDDARPASAIQFTRQFVQNADDNDDDVFSRRSDQSASVTFGENIRRSPNERRNSSRTSDNIQIETAFVGGDPQSKNSFQTNKNMVSKISTTTTVKAPQPVRTSLTVADSKKSSSSESPEWPSPPEPLTPMTPVNPDCHMEFDSDALKRMLQSLPVSPEEGNPDGEVGSKGKIIRTKSLSSHDKSHKEMKSVTSDICKSTSAILPKSESNQSIVNSTDTFVLHGNNTKSRSRLTIEEELRLRNKCVRDSYGQESYPDSGIGGMTADGAGSVCSRESSKLQKPSGKCPSEHFISAVNTEGTAADDFS